jgi:hypothetical protein
MKRTLMVSLAGSLGLSVGLVSAGHAATLVFVGSGQAGATNAFNAFQLAIGGGNNGSAPPRSDGFRTINWDGVGLNGDDANPNTFVVDLGKTVAIPVDRFRNVGTIYAEIYVVSGDGFASLNPDTAGEFPPFSPNNVFAMSGLNDDKFEDRFIEQSFVLPGTDVKASTRGFGAIFVDVETDTSSSIEYFNGSESLGTYYVPKANSGEPSFLGVLFDQPVITDVTMTVGTNTLFNVAGRVLQPFGPEDLAGGIDLAVTDDFVYAEPSQIPEPSLGLVSLVVAALGGTSWRRRAMSHGYKPKSV